MSVIEKLVEDHRAKERDHKLAMTLTQVAAIERFIASQYGENAVQDVEAIIPFRSNNERYSRDRFIVKCKGYNPVFCSFASNGMYMFWPTTHVDDQEAAAGTLLEALEYVGKENATATGGDKRPAAKTSLWRRLLNWWAS